MKKVISAILAMAMIISLVSIPAFSVLAAEVNILDEQYDNSSWSTNPSVFAKSNVENASEPAGTLLRPTSLTNSYVVYKFIATEGSIFSNMRIEFAARAINNSTVDLLAGTDNTNWKTVEKLYSPNDGGMSANLGIKREASATHAVKNSSVAYIKIEFKTATLAAASWASINYLKVYKQESAAPSSTETADLGTVINEQYNDSSWSTNNKLIETYNVTTAKVNGAVTQNEGSTFGYLVYEINLSQAATSLDIELKGRATTMNTSDNPGAWSNLEVFVSDSANNWKSAYLVTGKGLGGDHSNTGLVRTVSLDQFAGINKYYIMIKMRSGNAGCLDWVFLDYLKVNAGTRLTTPPVVGNGTLAMEGYDNDTFLNSGHIINAKNYVRGAVDSNSPNVQGISPSTTSHTAFVTCNYNTNLPMKTLTGNLQGRVISTDQNAYTYIEVQAAGKDEPWKVLFRIEANTLTNPFGEITTNKAFDLSQVANGKKSVYVQYVMKTVNTAGGNNTWAFINNLVIASTTDYKNIVSSETMTQTLLKGSNASAVSNSVTVNTAAGTKTVSVNWNTGTVDFGTPGIYNITGTFVQSSLDSNMLANLNNIVPQATITIVNDTALKAVEAKISALNLDSLTSADESLVTGINAEYEALSPAEKAFVTNSNNLKIAMAAIYPADPYGIIDASDMRIVYHGGSSFHYYENLEGKNYGMGGAAVGDYVSIPNVDFGTLGANKISVAATTRNAGEKLTVYIDNDLNAPVAEIVLPTGNGDNLDVENAQTVTASLNNIISGVHTLNIKWTTLTGSVFTIFTTQSAVNFGSLKTANGIVSGISSGQTVAQFLGTISVADGAVVTVKNGQEVYTGNVATDVVLEFDFNGEITSYTLSVKGDLNSDGLVNVNDLILSKNKLLNKITFSDTVFLAADFSKDSVIRIDDLLELKHLII